MTSINRQLRRSKPPISHVIPQCEGYIFFFPEERTYSLIRQSYKSMPENVDELVTGSEVTLKVDNQLVSAVFIRKGAIATLKPKLDKLEKRLQQNKSIDVDNLSYNSSTSTVVLSHSTSVHSSSASDISKDRQESSDSDGDTIIVDDAEQAVTVRSKPGAALSGEPVQDTDVQRMLLEALHEQNSLLRSTKEVLQRSDVTQSELRRELKRFRGVITDAKNRGTAEEAQRPKEPVMHDGMNLVEFTARNPQEFGTKLANHLFTKEELANGMLGQQRKRENARPNLSPMRSAIALKAIGSRYETPSNQQLARHGFNQVGLDHRVEAKRSRTSLVTGADAVVLNES